MASTTDQPAAARAASRGFTLVEMLVTLSLGVVVLGFVSLTLVDTFRLWLGCVAEFELTQQARSARERILRGIDGEYGLREARAFNLKVLVQGNRPAGNKLAFNAVDGSNNGKRCWVRVNNREKLVTKGKNPDELEFGRLNVSLAEEAFWLDTTNQVVVCDLRFYATSGGRRREQTHRLRACVLNE